MALVTHSFEQHQNRERRPLRKGQKMSEVFPQGGPLQPGEERYKRPKDAVDVSSDFDEGEPEEGDSGGEPSTEDSEHVRTFAERVSGG